MDDLGNCAQITNEKIGTESQGSQGVETKSRNKAGNISFKRIHVEEGEPPVTLSKGKI